VSRLLATLLISPSQYLDLVEGPAMMVPAQQNPPETLFDILIKFKVTRPAALIWNMQLDPGANVVSTKMTTSFAVSF